MMLMLMLMSDDDAGVGDDDDEEYEGESHHDFAGLARNFWNAFRNAKRIPIARVK